METKKAPTLEQYLQLNIQNIHISVPSYESRAFKKSLFQVELLLYEPNENISYEIISHKKAKAFKELHFQFTQKYPNVSLPEYPSSVSIAKNEKRLKFYNMFLKTIYEIAKTSQKEKQSSLLESLYNFVMQRSKKLTNDLVVNEIPLSKLQTIFKVHTSNQNQSQLLNEINTIASTESFITSDNDSENITPSQKSPFVKSLSVDTPSNVMPHLPSSSKTFTLGQSNDVIPPLSHIYFDKDLNEWGNVYFSSSYQKLSPVRIKVLNKCMYIYQNISNTNFYMIIPLFKINYDIYRIILPSTKTNPTKKPIAKLVYPTEIENISLYQPKATLNDLNSELEFKFNHDYSSFYFNIKFPSTATFTMINHFNSLIQEINTDIKDSTCISKLNETNLNIYGALYIQLLSLNISNSEGKYMIRVKLEPYSFYTKQLFMCGREEVSIDQSFVLPLHNRFKSIKFILYELVNEGLIIKKENKTKISEREIPLPELLNNLFINQKTITVSLAQFVTLTFKYNNCSSMSALFAKNKNTKIIEEYSAVDKEDDKHYSHEIVLKRIKKISILFQTFGDAGHTIITFKYPILSLLVMLIINLYLYFSNIEYVLTHLLLGLLIIMISCSKYYNKNIKKHINSFLYSKINPNAIPSIYIKHNKETQTKQIQQNDYFSIKEKHSFPSIKKLKEYGQLVKYSMFYLSYVIATIEKIKNLFMWTDPLLTLYVFCCVFVGFVLLYGIQSRYLLMIVVNAIFIKEMFYYKKKHRNNKAVARIVLKHSIQKMENKKKIMENPYQNEKVQKLIITKCQKYLNIKIHPDIFKVKNCDEEFLTNEIAKCDELFVFKKSNKLYQKYKQDKDRFTTVDIEVFLYWFLQNIKSDYYMISHNLIEDDMFIDKGIIEGNSPILSTRSETATEGHNNNETNETASCK